MNLGTLSGYFENYEIVETQCCMTKINSSHTWPGYFLAPPEATHALITASAAGAGSSTPEFIDPDQYYGTYAGGGAGAGCLRISFDLSVYRYIPFYAYFNTATLYIGSSGGTDLVDGPVYGGMPSIVLNEGTESSDQSTGGDGGGALWRFQHNNGSYTTITASGGSAGSDGKVICFPDGGVLAGGGGGGNASGKGGNVPYAPQTRFGAPTYISYGGGGASLFSDGIGGNLDGSNLRTSSVVGPKSTFNGFLGGYIYSVPGAGLPGREPSLDSGDFIVVKTISFIYCEFIAQKE